MDTRLWLTEKLPIIISQVTQQKVLSNRLNPGRKEAQVHTLYRSRYHWRRFIVPDWRCAVTRMVGFTITYPTWFGSFCSPLGIFYIIITGPYKHPCQVQWTTHGVTSPFSPISGSSVSCHPHSQHKASNNLQMELRGDMSYLFPGGDNPVRVHCCTVLYYPVAGVQGFLSPTSERDHHYFLSTWIIILPDEYEICFTLRMWCWTSQINFHSKSAARHCYSPAGGFHSFVVSWVLSAHVH